MRTLALRTIGALVALAVATVLASCGSATTGAPGAAPTTVRATPDAVGPRDVVMVIRHGEKPDGSMPGVDAEGNEDSSSLTEVGWERAHRLADLFGPTEGPLRPGLARPQAIYAAGANDDGEGQRTRETVQPLADRLGLSVDTSFGKGDEEKLVKHVIARPGPTLICWQHGELPAMAEAFPGVTPTPPSEWPDDRFDVIWTFTKTADGWHFAQMPELLLPQDQAGVIADDHE
jgi:hypothetical protein